MADGFPALKWFSPTDQTATLPTPITCYRVDKEVAGFSYSDWASWAKLTKLLSRFPF